MEVEVGEARFQRFGAALQRRNREKMMGDDLSASGSGQKNSSERVLY